MKWLIKLVKTRSGSYGNIFFYILNKLTTYFLKVYKENVCI